VFEEGREKSPDSSQGLRGNGRKGKGIRKQSTKRDRTKKGIIIRPSSQARLGDQMQTEGGDGRGFQAGEHRESQATGAFWRKAGGGVLKPKKGKSSKIENKCENAKRHGKGPFWVKDWPPHRKGVKATGVKT